MSHIWERQEVHKSSKCVEIVVTLFSEYCQTLTSMANLQKKLARALKDAAGVKGTGMAPANAMQASAALFEALGEVDGKLAKLAEKEYDNVSSEVRKHFKKMAKEEKAHDELTFNTNVKLKQASASYDKKVKGKIPYTADEHAKHVHLLSALGNEMAAAKVAHETLISQRHVTTLFAVGASLSRVADASWTGACEHVRRAGPHIGRIGQWRSLCEGGWAGAVPDDLPDIDKPGSGVIEKDKLGRSPRKEFHYPPSFATTNFTGTTTMTGSTNMTGTTSTSGASGLTSTTGTSTSTGTSTPLISPFPLTPIPGMGPNGAGGYFGVDDTDLKPPLPPFARSMGSPSPSQGTGMMSPRLASPAPIGEPIASATPPPIPQRKESTQFPPPPQHPASPTRPHAGLPPASPVRSNVGLPNDNHDGMPPPSPTRPFASIPGSYDTPPSPVRTPASPIRAPASPVRVPASPVRGPPSPVRTPAPMMQPDEAAPTPPTPSSKPIPPTQPSTPSPIRKPVERAWGGESWGAPNNEQEDPSNAEPPVSISRFLNENKDMGIDLEDATVRESVEKMAAAAREASEGSGQPSTSGWGGNQFEVGPTGTVKKLVLDEEKRVISGGPRPMPERPMSTVEGERRPLPIPLDINGKTVRKRGGSIESLTSSGSTSRVAAMRSRYDNAAGGPLSPPLGKERPALSHAVSDMVNAARMAEPQQIRGGVWPPRQAQQAQAPSSFPHQRAGLVSPSLDNLNNGQPSWSVLREREWRAREYALNLEQRELELERARLALQREHQQIADFTGSSSSTGAGGGPMSKSATMDVGSMSNAHHGYGRRPRSPESIPDDARPPWATKQTATTTRYTAPLRDESDNESTSPNSKEKKGTWMGRGLRRLSMPAPFGERKQIQVVSIPAPNREPVGNRRSFDIRQ
ncbi:hypothetical protein RhiJN_03606 [Ceratobasidium sp. AG-Ba]|nr:hypothetical protein RhiJN_03606 [Ceratobasidium sp. AG-Ba]QRW04501.1 hypothetical protein RhiLY_03500 [Ceratobasidium sp. AG-Ba]